MNLSLWAYLTIIALVAAVVFATIASVFVRRLLIRAPVPMSEEVGSLFRVLRKLRKREPMSDDEMALARQVVSDRRSLMAYSPLPFSASDASTCWAALSTCTEPHRPSARFSG
jgi:hypothetical protein